MTFLSYSTRHCLNREAFGHLLELFSIHNPEQSEATSTAKLRNALGECNIQLHDVCSKCNSLFPADEDIVKCPVRNCEGLRFKGPLSQQYQQQRKNFFASTPVENQIKDILERKDILKIILKYKQKCDNQNYIADIISGELYHSKVIDCDLLSKRIRISLLFNTDGVPLYNSSRVSIWPVYLVINELPPEMRFSKQNMILWGVWQSKGKPNFLTFFQPFVKDMIVLEREGITITVDKEDYNCKAILLAGTLDLQAKAILLEMMHHNGEYGCATCEEPGIVVPQGKGHARVYPFRNNAAPLRTTDGMYIVSQIISLSIKLANHTKRIIALEHFKIGSLTVQQST